MAGAESSAVVQNVLIQTTATSVNPIRIHLGHMPAMLRRIVSDLLSAEPDFIVVGSSRPDEDPLVRARQELADMVITEDRSGSGPSTLDLIISGPPISIFAIASHGQTAAAVDLVRRPINLDTGRKAALADAIRSVAAGL
jgi:DNA-binding NarL/FixJ family response regulator